MWLALERCLCSVSPRLGRVAAIACTQATLPLLVIQLEAQARGMVESGCETATRGSIDHSPVLFMTICVADDCVQQKIADEHVPCRDVITNAVGNRNAIERLLNRFDRIPDPLSADDLYGDELVAVNQLLRTLQLVAGERCDHRLAYDAVARHLTGVLYGKLRSSRGDAEPFGHPIGDPLRPIVALAVSPPVVTLVVGGVLHEPAITLWIPEPTLRLRSERLPTRHRPVRNVLLDVVLPVGSSRRCL